mgnify:CR=1 FL=1
MFSRAVLLCLLIWCLRIAGSTAGSSAKYPVGSRIEGNFAGNDEWFAGTVSQVHQNGGTTTYDIAYDDGDAENGIPEHFVRPVQSSDTVQASSPVAAEATSPAGGSGNFVDVRGDTFGSKSIAKWWLWIWCLSRCFPGRGATGLHL